MFGLGFLLLTSFEPPLQSDCNVTLVVRFTLISIKLILMSKKQFGPIQFFLQMLRFEMTTTHFHLTPHLVLIIAIMALAVSD